MSYSLTFCFRAIPTPQEFVEHKVEAPLKITTKRKYSQACITPDSTSEQSSSDSVHSCPDIEYSFSDRPEADQYLDDVSTPSTAKNTTQQQKFDRSTDEVEKYFLSNDAPRSSSEELSLSFDFSDDTSFDDRSDKKNNENCSAEIRGSSVESHENKLPKANPNSNSYRKGSVTFCDESNQIVILKPNNYSKNKAKNSDRKIGLYGKARHSPNLLHNPYGPPLYHHSRPITTTTSDKVKSLTPLKIRTQDQNVMTTKTKFSSVVESSDMETNGSGIQSHPVSKMNVPIKTYQKDYKKEIFQSGKMTDQHQQDTKKRFNNFSISSSRDMKENFVQ